MYSALGKSRHDMQKSRFLKQNNELTKINLPSQKNHNRILIIYNFPTSHKLISNLKKLNLQARFSEKNTLYNIPFNLLFIIWL